jgi:hypothetical protein
LGKAQFIVFNFTPSSAASRFPPFNSEPIEDIFSADQDNKQSVRKPRLIDPSGQKKGII